MASAKLATLGFLKIHVFWNKGYGFIISVYEITSKILPGDQSLVTLAFKWEKLSLPQFYKDLIKKINFFWWLLLFQVQLLGSGFRYGLEILQQCGDWGETKIQKVLDVNSYVCKLQGKNLQWGFFVPSNLKRVKLNEKYFQI